MDVRLIEKPKTCSGIISRRPRNLLNQNTVSSKKCCCVSGTAAKEILAERWEVPFSPAHSIPIHFGHIDIARRASRIFDEVIVAVYDKPMKNRCSRPKKIKTGKTSLYR